MPGDDVSKRRLGSEARKIKPMENPHCAELRIDHS